MTSYTKKQLETDIHELRRPLNRIAMQAELLDMLGINGLNEETFPEIVKKLKQASKECSNGLQDLYSRLDAVLDNE